jgi:hypothetical protein
MNRKFDDYIETFTGKKFHFLDPQPEEIDIIDIAHSLGMQCRYTGHARTFYSIAEHSIIVSDLCSPEAQLWGLLHDASEAYLTDVASPIKQFLGRYRDMEQNLMNAIATKYGLSIEMPEEVHTADRIVLLAEAEVLITSGAKDWMTFDADIEIPNIKFDFHTPKNAKYAFLDRFEDLMILDNLRI